MKCAIEKMSACKRETTCINDASSFTFDKVVESKCYNWDSTPKKNICQGLNHRMPFEIFLSLPWAWLQPEKTPLWYSTSYQTHLVIMVHCQSCIRSSSSSRHDQVLQDIKRSRCHLETNGMHENKQIPGHINHQVQTNHRCVVNLDTDVGWNWHRLHSQWDPR